MKSIILAILLVGAAHQVALATEPFPATIKEVSLSARGPASAGTIQVEASVNSDNLLVLKVESDFGIFVPGISVREPYLHSLTVDHCGEIEGVYKNFFAVCLWYGEVASINVGSEDNPEWQHQANKITYSFFPGGFEHSIDKNSQRIMISDCNP